MSSSLLSLFFFAFAATVVSFSSGAGAYTISDCGPCECRPGEDLVLPARIGTDGCPVCICKPIPGAIDRGKFFYSVKKLLGRGILHLNLTAIDSFAGVAAGSFDFKGLVSATVTVTFLLEIILLK